MIMHDRGRRWGIGGGGGGRAFIILHVSSVKTMHRPSHSYNAETEHVEFSPTRQALLAPSCARRGGIPLKTVLEP